MWNFFKREEFACRHCGENRIADDFVTKLDELRRMIQFPLIVSSGYRCPMHNQAVSSTGPRGPHTTGRAVDLAVSRGLALELIEEAIASGRFTGYGICQHGTIRFIHLDDLREPEHRPRPTIWSYP